MSNHPLLTSSTSGMTLHRGGSGRSSCARQWAFLALLSVAVTFLGSSLHEYITIIPKLSYTDTEEHVKPLTKATLGPARSVDILRTASAAGRFASRSPDGRGAGNKELNWTDEGGVRYRAPPRWAERAGFSHTLGESFHRVVHSPANSGEVTASLPALDRELVEGLRGKTLLFIGSSTQANIHSAMCHCPRAHGANASAQGSMEHDSQTECFEGTGAGCIGPELSSCRLRSLNVTFHNLQGEYAVHPYGHMPYGRGENPVCPGSMGLAACLKKKWDASCNLLGGLACMGNSSCPTIKGPDIVFFDVNLWFWFRMGWYGPEDEKDFMAMPWGEIEEAYMVNITTVLHTIAEYFPSARVIALQTTPGTKTPSRVAMPNVMHVNSAIREIAAEHAGGGADGTLPPVGLLELEHMGHMGWDRERFLLDDMHPMIVFNRAVSNILLNALAVL